MKELLKCQKPLGGVANGSLVARGVCNDKATYSFVLEGLNGLEDGMLTRRCAAHMALNLARVELTNLELSTIQKI